MQRRCIARGWNQDGSDWSAGDRNQIEAAVRNGLSLLEVIISVAIFLGAMTAIMQGLSVGQRSELAARLQSEAVLRSEAKMGEILCGAEEPNSSEGNSFEDDETGNWEWSVNVKEGGAPGLLQVTVAVEHKPGGDEPNAGFTLVRLMRDPQLFLDAALQESE
jgi:general secretion pathway protein I